MPQYRSRRKTAVSALLVLSLAIIAVLLCVAQPPFAGAQTTRPSTMTTFLVIYRPGPAWALGKPIKEQPPREHGKYLLGLFAKGSMKFAGPFTDDAGAAIVLEAASEADARSLVGGDPAVQQGIFLFDLHPWELVPWQKYLKK
jgi:uncharacterized protein